MVMIKFKVRVMIEDRLMFSFLLLLMLDWCGVRCGTKLVVGLGLGLGLGFTLNYLLKLPFRVGLWCYSVINYSLQLLTILTLSAPRQSRTEHQKEKRRRLCYSSVVSMALAELNSHTGLKWC